MRDGRIRLQHVAAKRQIQIKFAAAHWDHFENARAMRRMPREAERQAVSA
jgi:hypothetical protein